MATELNVLGSQLQPCCYEPMTGYFRDGFCRTTAEDTGTHTVCAVVTSAFLAYTKSKGNDLSTPMPYWNFPGLKPGDKWCLCISRWLQAKKAGKAPLIILESCHRKTLEYTDIETLLEYKHTTL
ncbi:DUF2237 domain-containing protein [Aquimarina sp. MMG016]|uniref:DUF2237 family protein n=1 Tax=Aquimarina sp. MMG016 TaxID=2822690 RepID=UPI001B3A28F1|nr:DUF2237 domain-containing protein [Aquimarina sp. MMG016]MBQ4820764.1 DUF2237 domain-containing protein [Aquimarina sp. MMG016]